MRKILKRIATVFFFPATLISVLIVSTPLWRAGFEYHQNYFWDAWNDVG